MTQKKINSILKTEQYHVFYKNKELKPLAHKTQSGVEKAIKENVNPPKTDKKVYLVKIRHLPDIEKKYILLSCCKNTITPKLLLTKKKDDDCFTTSNSSFLILLIIFLICSKLNLYFLYSSTE